MLKSYLGLAKAVTEILGTSKENYPFCLQKVYIRKKFTVHMTIELESLLSHT